MIEALQIKFKHLFQDEAMRRIGRGAVSRVAVTVMGMVLGYLLNVFLARWLGAEEYGKYSFVISLVAVLVTTSLFGFGISSLRFLPEYSERRQWDRVKGFVLVALVCVLTFSSIYAGLLWLLTQEFLFSESLYSDALAVGVFLIPVFALLRLQSEFLRAYHRIEWAYAPDLVLRPILFLSIGSWMIAMGSGMQAADALSIALGSAFIALIVQLSYAVRCISASVKSVTVNVALREWFSVSGPLFLSSLFLVALQQTDIVLVGILLGAQSAGQYAAAVKIASLVSIPIIAVNTVVAPMYAALYASGNRDKMQILSDKIIHLLFWPTLIAALGVLIFGKFILSIFGDTFLAAYSCIPFLAFGFVFSSSLGVVGCLVDLTGRQKVGAKIRGICVSLNILFNIALIPIFGIVGAAMATMITKIIWFVLLHRIVAQDIGIRPSIGSFFQRRISDIRS